MALMGKIESWISPWIYGPLAFLLWVFLLNLAKNLIIHKIKRLSQRSIFHFGEMIAEAARFPLSILILGSGIYILQLLLPLEQKYTQAALIAFQASVIIGSIIFLDSAIRAFGSIYAQRAEFAFFSKGILQGLVRGVVIGLGLLIFLDMIGIPITPLLASLGVGSLAIGLALQDTLTNFFAGIYITIDKPVRVGDFVKIETGEEGYVTEVGWRATRIQMLPNNMVIVPNHKLITSILTNYYLPTRELAVLIQVGVHYDSNLKKVEEVTIDAARQVMKTVNGGIPEFDPFIRYHTFGDSSINFTVILRAREFVDQYLIKHEFIKALHERYQQEGIVIPFPIRTLDLSKETLATLTNRS
ncbi:MAG: mechanosensitive ion channel family protein [Candidatus Omnitrophica bacterium]|nr:mechanosensitive ion channel family protein [Candidatus Omnitrophota bacterium]